MHIFFQFISLSMIRISDEVVQNGRRPPTKSRGTSLQLRHNEPDGVSNHQPRDCLLNRLFRRRSKKTSKLRVTGLCAGNSPATGEFPAQRASNAENVSIWWRHHVACCCDRLFHDPWRDPSVSHLGCRRDLVCHNKQLFLSPRQVHWD